MKILVWQWGRRGAGPRFGACLAAALRGRPGIEVVLSLCRDAEIMAGTDAPVCEMPVRTYRGMATFLLRVATAPVALLLLMARLRRVRPDLAICAMPGPLDLLMALALRPFGTRLVVVVHEAEAHPGDGFPFQMLLQRLLCRCAGGLAVLCTHVGTQLANQGLAGRPPTRLIRFEHPPFGFDMPDLDCRAGPPRLLCFGRLLPYKGLDLLAGALALLPPDTDIAVRIVGCGPESPALAALRRCTGVIVENRWVPEIEIGSLLAWSDALILPYREASQSGVAAAALAAGRPVIATRVGGLREQLSNAPLAVMCEPEVPSLSDAIQLWLQAPRQIAPRFDSTTAWRQAATDLMVAIEVVLPAKLGHPVTGSACPNGSPAGKTITAFGGRRQ